MVSMAQQEHFNVALFLQLFQGNTLYGLGKDANGCSLQQHYNGISSTYRVQQ
jgi:hypothetical protein